MTQICVALTDTSTAGMIDRMVDLQPLADLFEVRADALQDFDLLTLLRAKTRPLVFTCRPREHGGIGDMDREQRRALLMEAVKRGYDYVDVEHDSGFTDVMIEKAGHGLIISHHDFEGMPAELDQLYVRMTALGADVAKIAVTPRSVADVGHLLDFATHVQRMGGPALIPIAMGPLGTLTRVLGGRFGVPFTFASPQSGRETAPGQLSASELAMVYRARSVTAATRVYGVLGRDVTHSLSPVLHNSAFSARGVDAVYVPLQAEALEPFMDVLPAFGLSGFSVTRPYKVEILNRLSEIDEVAANAGSVNTVTVRADGSLSGTTSDGLGVLAPLRRHLEIKGRTVMIVGAGGAARSAGLALVRRGARVTVLARRPEQAEEVAKAVGCTYGPLSALAGRPWDVLINATPVGSRPDVQATPVAKSLLRAGAVVFDMVYTPLETRLLRDARAAGCTTIDGLEMLVAQAAAQFEAWTGQEAPQETMREAALEYIADREDRA